MFSRMLLPTDGTACSFAAAEYARDLLKLNSSSRLTIIHVRKKHQPVYRVYRWREVEVPLSDEEKRRICEAEERILAQTEKIFTDAGLATDTDVVTGAPAEEICAYAEKGGYDLIIMGSENAGAIKNIPKSVSHNVLCLAKCPVLVIKAAR